MSKPTLYERVSRIIFTVLEYVTAVLPKVLTAPKGGIILCYHNIGKDGWRFTTSPKEFAAHIKYLNKHYTLKSLSEVLKTGTGVAITFDDGYRGVYEYAPSILAKYGVAPTVFVLGEPERANRRELQNSLPLMTTTQVKKLAKAGWEIGFHTKTHVALQYLAADDLVREIEKGRRDSSKRYGVVHRYFAYPKGFFTNAIETSVLKAGFEAAFLVNGGATKLHQNPLRLDRIPMEKGYDDKRLAVLISPLGMVTTIVFSKILRAKESFVQTRRAAIV